MHGCCGVGDSGGDRELLSRRMDECKVYTHAMHSHHKLAHDPVHFVVIGRREACVDDIKLQ